MATLSSATPSKRHSHSTAYFITELQEIKTKFAQWGEELRQMETKLQNLNIKHMEKILAKLELKQERSSHSIHEDIIWLPATCKHNLPLKIAKSPQNHTFDSFSLHKTLNRKRKKNPQIHLQNAQSKKQQKKSLKIAPLLHSPFVKRPIKNTSKTSLNLPAKYKLNPSKSHLCFLYKTSNKKTIKTP